MSAAASGGADQSHVAFNINGKDVYSYLHSLEPSMNPTTFNEDYLLSLDEYLNSIEQDRLGDSLFIEKEKIEKLEIYLEGLYGENSERFASMVLIRRLSKDDESLSKISLNKLLTCAMLRTLRESEHKDQNLSLQIFYCLIRFASFKDVHYQVFVENEQNTDLIQTIVDFLVEHVKALKAAPNRELKTLLDQHYFTNSLLTLTINLLWLDNPKLQIKHRLLRSHGEKFLNSLLEIFRLATKYLMHDIRLISKPERVVSTQSRIVLIISQLSVYKEFINLIRMDQSFFESIINLVNVLQLSRPGSGTANADASRIVNDEHLINQLYELEMDLLKLVNNLLFDHKLKIKLIKRNLLKCVLRNLVVFLASRKSNTLNPFDRSPVLLIPFKCLYELSCSDSIKVELYKSKIILKCLLEYLLSCAADLKPALDLKRVNLEKVSGLSEDKAITSPDPPDQIVIEPNAGSHYIVSLWINLSARCEATIYGDDLELRDLVCEYVDLATNNLRAFLVQVHNFPISKGKLKNEHSMLYLHSKLLRNLTQFFEIKEPPLTTDLEYWKKWILRMTEASSEFLHNCRNDVNSIHLTVECLATLNNLLFGNGAGSKRDPTTKPINKLQAFKSPQMSLLLDRLFQLNFSKLSVDNDDLLLVSIIFIGNFARNSEICELLTGNINSKILSSSNFILEYKTTDYKMISYSLYTLAQLMKHSTFLREIKLCLSNDKTNTLDEALSGQLDQLIDKLANLTLHGSPVISKFAIILLDRLRHFDEDQGDLHERRFAVYNAKWLDAMRASREGLLALGIEEISETNYKVKPNSSKQKLSQDDQSVEDDEVEADELVQLRAIEEEGLDSDRAVSTASSLPRYTGIRSREVQKNGEDVDDVDDEDDLDEDDNEFEGPDLNVIDSNSMIKHLTTRREFRSEWMRR